MNALTAAHPSLPFGTVVTARNLANGHSADLVITDRGPFVKGRIIDVSYRAAQVLDFVNAGTAQVHLQVFDRAGQTAPAQQQLRVETFGGTAAPVIASSGTRLQCVPYARQISGIHLRGDAWTWWQHAKGRYGRSLRPAPGAVLVMSKSQRLRYGHLAVVTRIVSHRQVLVDQANWLGKGRIHRNVPVVDVSPNNDWSQVRVWYTPGNTLGLRHYGVSGFIHPSTVMASD